MISSEVAEGGAPRPVPTGVHLQRDDVLDSRADGQRCGAARASRACRSRSPSRRRRRRWSPPRRKPLPRRSAATQRTRRCSSSACCRRANTWRARSSRSPASPMRVVTRVVPPRAGGRGRPTSRRSRRSVAGRRCPGAAAGRARSRRRSRSLPSTTCLKPDVVRPFLDYLQREHPVSAANAAIVAAGARRARTSLHRRRRQGAPTATRSTLAFIRGLAQLQKKQYAAGRRRGSSCR